MTLQELLQLLGSKEVEIYTLKKRVAELEAQVAELSKEKE